MSLTGHSNGGWLVVKRGASAASLSPSTQWQGTPTGIRASRLDARFSFSRLIDSKAVSCQHGDGISFDASLWRSFLGRRIFSRHFRGVGW